MNYAIEQRLRFIDCMLVYYGSISRAELIDFYGIGEATATRDIKLYHEKAPNNLVFDNSAKRYLAGAGFKRIYS